MSWRALSKEKKNKGSSALNFGLVEYADIPILDFSVFDKPGGKEKLAGQLKEAVQQTGMSATLLYICTIFPRKEKGKKSI